MKKTWLFLPMTAIILIAGCNASSTPVKMQTDFNLNACIEKNDVKSQTIVKRSGAGIEVTYCSPSLLKDMSYSFNGDTASISYQGITQNFPKQGVMEASDAGMISAAIEDALPKSGNPCIKGTISSGSYQLDLNNKTGLPALLSIPEQNFTCNFKQ